MLVRDVMTRGLVAIEDSKTLAVAAEIMNQHNIGFLPVMKGAQIIGVVTDRDITTKATAHGLAPDNTRISVAMTPGVISCEENQDINEAGELMSEHQIRRLLVYDRDGTITGVISLGDIANLASAADTAADTLRCISRRAPVAVAQ